MPRSVLRIGTRSSALALSQAETVRRAIQEVITKRNFELVPMMTEGDLVADSVMPMLGGAGVVTSEIELAIAEGKIDLAVHNAADLAIESHELVVLAAVPARMDPRDALLTRRGSGFGAMQPATRIGVSSRARAAQLLAFNRGFVPMPMCGNVDIRLRKLTAGDCDALLLSVAGLKRLGKADRVSEVLSADVMLPAAGQGSLVVQCRATDKDMRAALAQIEDPGSRRAFDTERAFVDALGGDVHLPIAALAKLDAQMIKLRALISSLDGQTVMREIEIGDDPEKVGRTLAERMLDSGAGDLLAAVKAAG